MTLLTPREAAARLGVSYPTVKQWIYKGSIRTRRTAGGHHRVPATEVDRLLARTGRALPPPLRGGATIVTPFLVVMLFEARGVAGVMALMIGLLVVQIVTVWALGIEPRHRSLEELKGDETSPALVKQAT